MKPTLAFVAGHLSGGGTERQLLYLLRGLAAYPVRVTLATLNPGDPGEAAFEALGIPVERIPRSRWKIDRLVRIAAWLRREQPVVVHSWAFYGNIYAAWAGALTGVPVRVGSLQGDLFFEKSANTVQWKAPPFYVRLGLRAPHAVMVNSGVAAAAVAARGPRGTRLHVVRNGMDLATLCRVEGSGTREAGGLKVEGPAKAGPSLSVPQPLTLNPQPPTAGPVLALVGRLISLKNAPMFLRAVAVLAGRYPGLEGWLIGDGPERIALEALARELGVAERIRFWGWCSDVPGLLSRADVLCHCSHSEGICNAIMEGSALGLPVVVTRTGGAPEIVDDGVTGFLVDPDDDAAMALQVDRLLADPDLRGRVGAAGRRKMETEFSQERLVTDMFALYCELLAERGLQGALAQV